MIAQPLLPWKRNNVLPFYCWPKCNGEQYTTPECIHGKRRNGFLLHCNLATKYFVLLWTTWTYFRRYSKHPILVFDFKQIWSFSTDFLRSLQYKISRKCAVGSPLKHMDRLLEEQTWRSQKVLVAIYAKALKKNSCWTTHWYKWRSQYTHARATILQPKAE
jgi:hypothetical protein